MEVKILHEKATIFEYLKKNIDLQIYCIGDLDDFFWSKTIWYALVDQAEIKAIALLYIGMEISTLLAFDEYSVQDTYRLLERIKSILPNKFYAHLSPGLVEVFGVENIIQHFGVNYKMALAGNVKNVEDENIRRLNLNDLPIIKKFYFSSYPSNWFDSRMLETNKYFGYFKANELIGVAGIHVFSSEYKVAALGNIATNPKYRGQQICYKLTSVLCNDLINSDVSSIGLNVRSDNQSAIYCYQKIGFEIIGKYEECFVRNSD